MQRLFQIKIKLYRYMVLKPKGSFFLKRYNISASNHNSLYIPSIKKSFILRYSRLRRIASNLLKPTNPSTDNNTPAKTIPTNNEVLDVLSFKLSFVWTSFSGFVVLGFLVVVDDMDVLVVATVFFVVDFVVVVVDGAKVTVVEFFFKLFKSSTCTLASVTTSTPGFIPLRPLT